ncbi:MAG: protein kinase [Tepidisphaeraceae bacterium]|jgi:serine/threonine protein kinase
MKFQRGEKIGSGGFGEVLKCTCLEDGGIFAMKRLTKPDEESRKRFAREVRMQATLRHKNIVPILASNLTVESPFYIMSLATTCLRRTLVVTHGEELLWIVRHIAQGLRHAHDNGVRQF